MQLIETIQQKESFLCVGLDSDPNLLPPHLAGKENAIFEFNRAIIDATAPYAVAYKPNTAFYEAEGAAGWEQLEATVAYIKTNYPECFVIADAKRGDIGNTAQRYARAFFERMDCDAVTLAPYMGKDSIAPFLAYENKYAIVLALTSNPSAVELETRILNDGTPLYEQVIRQCLGYEGSQRIMFVVGATRPEKLADIRALAPDSFFLVPGVGAQGGTVEEVAKYGLNAQCGLLVNSSRGIIFASKGEDFAEEAGRQARILAEKMAAYL